MREGEKGGLGGEIGGLEVLRDLVDGLADTWVVTAHDWEYVVVLGRGRLLSSGPTSSINSITIQGLLCNHGFEALLRADRR